MIKRTDLAAVRFGLSVFQSLSFWVFVIVMAICYAAFSVLGVQGLVIAAAGVLGSAVLGYLYVFRPELIFVGWIFAMSTVTYFGLLRMPGVPDLSFPRLFLVLTMLLIITGALAGRPLLVRPVVPDILITLHTIYVLINLKLIGNPEAFHSWYNSSLAPLVAFLFAKQWIKTDRQLRSITYWLLGILAYFSIVSAGEHFEITALVWPRQIMDRTIMEPYFGRSRGPFFQPGIFGMMIGMLFLLNILAITRRTQTWVKFLLWVNLIISGLGLLYTYTRGGWVATIMGVLFLSALRPRFRKVVIAGVLVGVLVATFGVVDTSKDQVLADRIENTGTIENRLGFLAAASRMIRINPLFGIGYFRYMELEPLYNKGTYIPLYGYVKKELGAGVPIHDIYIGRAAEEGLISLALFLGFLFSIAVEFWRKWRLNPKSDWFDRDVLASMAAIIIAYLLGGMVQDYRYFDNVNVIAMFFCGILAGYPVAADSVLPGGAAVRIPTHSVGK